MPNVPVIAHLCSDRFQVAFSAAFGDCVGTYGGDDKITINDLSAATGIKKGTLEAYRDGQFVPRGFVLFQLMEVLPARFTNRLLALIGMGGARKMSPEEIDFHQVAQGAAEYTNAFVAHMADGRIDHVEQIEEIELARKLRDNLEHFLLAHDGPKTGKGDGGKVTNLPKRAGA
ncbi:MULTISPECIES: hypothetical protein [unclassified Thalassospira]|uniref:hypothetical protein n=1 Tax=unclassified Thalassospira TaxID=2648997 RepID=UPI0007A5A09E|nr:MULTISPECIES: hypothetical protein [unclassified Thalassospira]KZC99722.1 hypothetical protein AUQ41_08580 [Thalassospira sp. MCCC 1A02898]ONH85348.1 hypothetical protein TH47_05755 [Thalassospira sp. MCCC 1A02803]